MTPPSKPFLDSDPPRSANLSLARQTLLLQELAQRVAERTYTERSLRQTRAVRESAALERYQLSRKKCEERYRSEQARLQAEQSLRLSQIVDEYESTTLTAAHAFDESNRLGVRQADAAIAAGKARWEQLRRALEIREGTDEQTLAAERNQAEERLGKWRQELQVLEDQLARELRRRRVVRAPQESVAESASPRPAEPQRILQQSLQQAREALESFQRHRSARFLQRGYLIPVLLVGWLLAIIPAAMLFPPGRNPEWVAIVVSGSAALVTTFGVYLSLRPFVVQASRIGVGQFERPALQARQALATLQASLEEDAARRLAQLQTRLRADLQRADEQWNQQSQVIKTEKDVRLQKAREEYQGKRDQAVHIRDERLQACNTRYAQLVRDVDKTYHEELKAFDDARDQELSISQEAFSRGHQRLVSQWNDGMRAFEHELNEMRSYCNRRFPPWEQLIEQEQPAVSDSLAAIRFGHFRLSPDHFRNGDLTFSDYVMPTGPVEIPAVLSAPDHPSLLLQAWGTGRETACHTLQNVMLRLLTAIPPGKVRFTIIDAAGLGKNFAGFMHLADYDPRLVNHRIWTESAQIQQRLGDLADHLQNVIQKYLRNEFATIEEYNRFAGEVAEPYHILVVANFPAGFSEEAAQQLATIHRSGPRCGVFTLISTDSRLEVPRNFDASELETHSLVLHWDGNRFVPDVPQLRDLPLELEAPPADAQQTELIRRVGRLAKDASRVEVPFATVAPADDKWWQSTSARGVDVPLGRAGASKLQYLRLGSGTSQHVLIAGKTGSGKSTLLHALITNLALHYSPSELQFYLIDFKKGVEFKPYAVHRLPHAAVVAIESEREFGMSVLERLDLELRRRGDLFRAAGVQDVRNYRAACPDEPLPRLLLIIDEFQEFFVQDDKLSQDAALLLDRLVRQGRAFGIHVLLGSQTLAGAYSLARSTLGQMAVRIALQCSEADAHLILSEDNTAARLLHRPGEAIYNDANGLLEGNHPFQVVWLAAHDMERYLKRLSARAASEMSDWPAPIVFEGNAAADPAENAKLQAALTGVISEPAPTAWLGAAVAIKDPTSAVFRRQAGANLLIVGQHEESALGILAASVVGLAATTHKSTPRLDTTMTSVASDQEFFTEPISPSPRFWILDGIRPDSPEVGFWKRLTDYFPGPWKISEPPDAGKVLVGLAADVQARLRGEQGVSVPQFLIITNLGRIRELRRAEDDFRLSSLDDEETSVSPSQQLATVIREGPAVGIHTLVWCDTYATVQRWFDRQTIRDLDLRVLFQMSAGDSTNLMDSPAASRLGNHRALLYSEELGLSEKFRPYGLPSSEWLSWARSRYDRPR